MFNKHDYRNYMIHKSPIWKKCFCGQVILVLLLIICLSRSSMAYAVNGQDALKDTNNIMSTATAEIIVNLKEAKGNPELTEAEKKARLHWLETTIINMRTENKTWEEIANSLKGNGFELITSPESDREDTSSPLSTGEQVTMYRPSIIYDNVAKEYVIIGEMEWNYDGDNFCFFWYHDTPYFGGDVGGCEGVGLELGYSPYTKLEQYFLVGIDTRGNQERFTNPFDWDPTYGVTFNPQDRCWDPWYGKDYNFHKYMIFSTWTVSRPVSNLPVKHRYAHTWSSTGVTSATVGPNGITFTFSSESNKWTVVSPPCYWTI